MPKIFVGTLHSDEADYSACLEMLQKQQNVEVTHHVVSGLSEIDAHNELWNEWRKHQQTHDFFVKVDADTVLRSDTTLSEINNEFLKNPDATGLQAPLHDYMTNELIDGLNAYRSIVTFNNTNDSLYCDRAVTINNSYVIRTNLSSELVPAGFHCHHANELQGFHYGVHRMMKGQKDNVHKVIVAWDANRDRTRGFAMIGGLMAGRFFKDRRFNYTDVEFKAAYDEANSRYDEFMGAIEQGRFDLIN